jgi:DegV family protein with EDD domain
VANVAFVTDSASDLDPAVAKAAGIRIVPLSVTFGSESFRAGVDLSTEEFWTRMTAPNAPFPKTAATGPGDFKAVYDEAFAAGADAIVAIHVSHKLSGAMKSAELAAGMLPDREIHIVDSQGASMAQGILAFMGLEMAKLGVSAEEIGRVLNDRASDLRMYVSLETLEYLKKGGRISGTQAMIGTLLSVRPIIAVEDGVVETADKPRTRAK